MKSPEPTSSPPKAFYITSVLQYLASSLSGLIFYRKTPEGDNKQNKPQEGRVDTVPENHSSVPAGPPEVKNNELPKDPLISMQGIIRIQRKLGITNEYPPDKAIQIAEPTERNPSKSLKTAPLRRLVSTQKVPLSSIEEARQILQESYLPRSKVLYGIREEDDEDKSLVTKKEPKREGLDTSSVPFEEMDESSRRECEQLGISSLDANSKRTTGDPRYNTYRMVKTLMLGLGNSQTAEKPALASANNGVAGTEKITKRSGDINAVVPESSLKDSRESVLTVSNPSAQQVISGKPNQH